MTGDNTGLPLGARREKMFGELSQLDLPKFLEHLGIGFFKVNVVQSLFI